MNFLQKRVKTNLSFIIFNSSFSSLRYIATHILAKELKEVTLNKQKQELHVVISIATKHILNDAEFKALPHVAYFFPSQDST